MDEGEQQDKREERNHIERVKGMEFKHSIWRTGLRACALVVCIFFLTCGSYCSYTNYLRSEALKNNVDPYKVKMLFDGTNTQVDPNLMIEEMTKIQNK